MNRRNVIMIELLFCACVSANTIVVDSYASGWYDHRGDSFGSSGSNLVGLDYLMGIPYRYNTFYIFTIPALGADVAGVTFHLELAAYDSEDTTENILLSGVSAPVQELVSVHTIREGLVPRIYNDLMDGPEYGGPAAGNYNGSGAASIMVLACGLYFIRKRSTWKKGI